MSKVNACSHEPFKNLYLLAYTFYLLAIAFAYTSLLVSGPCK